MNLSKNLSYKHRILLGNFLVAMIPMLILIVTFMRVFVISLERQDREGAFRQIHELSSYFENYLEDHRQVMDYISDNMVIRKALMGEEAGSRNDIYIELYRATEGMRKGVSASIYDRDGKMRWGTLGTKEGTHLSTRWGVLGKASRSHEMVMYGGSIDGGVRSRGTLWLSKAIEGGDGEIIGYVVMEITTTAFQDLLNSFAMDGQSLMIMDRFGYLIYSSDNIYLSKDTTRNIIDAHGKGRLSVLKGEDRFSFLKKDDRYGYYIFLTIPAGMSSEAVHLMKWIGLLGLVVAMGFSGFVSFMLSRGLTRPINDLKQAIENVEKGNLDTRISSNRMDEFGDLSNSFDRMNENLQLYTKELVDREREILEIRIRLLQAQLNPHFLYNSLDTIKWMARMNGVSSVADIVNDLAQILRCSISSSQFISLREELDVVESYIGIQKIRFSDRFTHEILVPRELWDIQIPKLILQPIVENSIIHGLAEREEGHIVIHGGLKDENLVLTIEDNGCGIPEDMSIKFNQGEFENNKGHLGLYNIYYILKLYYGEDYGIHIVSSVGEGTKTYITLPIGGDW